MKKILSLILATSLLLGTTQNCFAMVGIDTSGGENIHITAENIDNIQTSKSEVIYGVLSPNGDVNELLIVNEFDLSKAGSITDYGTYSSVKNLTDTSDIANSNSKISLNASEKGKFYYQGSSVSKELPWDISIVYYLDGVELTPENIAGKEGELEIKIKTQKNNNMKTEYYENYMLQISLSLDETKCKNISSKDATIASAGASKMITFTVMPESDADFSVTADVEDFEMAGISISAIPFSMSIDMPNMSESTEGIDELSDGVLELYDGTIELSDGSTEIADGISELSDGSVEFLDALIEMQEGVSELLEGSHKIEDGIYELATGSEDFLDGLFEMYKGARELEEGSSQIYNGLKQLNQGLSDANLDIDLTPITALPLMIKQLATSIENAPTQIIGLTKWLNQGMDLLEQSINNIPDTPISGEEINSLTLTVSNLDSGEADTLNTLISYYENATLVKRAYIDASPLFNQVSTTLTGLSTSIQSLYDGLILMATEIESSLNNMDLSGIESIADLSSGINTLVGQYGSFHTGLIEMNNGISSAVNGYDDLNEGINDLYEQYGDFTDGISEFDDGVDTAIDGYIELNDGISEFDSQYKEFDDGVSEMSDGVSELNDGTKTMSDEVQAMIDDFSADYDNHDYLPSSFTSDKNTNVSAVQFVLKTDEIVKEDIEIIEEVIIEEKTMWDRFLDLFR